MSDTKQISEAEVDAIRQILSEGGRLDYIDVVNAVRTRFRLNVSSDQVEQVAQEMVNQKPRAQVSLNLNSQMPVSDMPDRPRKQNMSKTVVPQRVGPLTQSIDDSKSDLDHALNYVKLVGGLANAKRALQELEAILVGNE